MFQYIYEYLFLDDILGFLLNAERFLCLSPRPGYVHTRIRGLLNFSKYLQSVLYSASLTLIKMISHSHR